MTDLSELLADTSRRAQRYLAEVDQRPVAADSAALAALKGFDEPLPDDPTDPAATIALLDTLGAPATIASAGGRYFGVVTGGTLPAALASSWLVAAWDQNAALAATSPIAAKLHDVAGDWLVDLLGLPDGTETAFVTGATVANASCLAAARDRQLAAVGWDAPSQGLFGAPEITVVIGEQAHSTVVKSLSIVGLGRDRVIRVPVDDQGAMLADALPDVDPPVIVCAQAGEVNTGAFDPFGPVVEWARKRQGWVHVDGAFGLWALADPGRAALVEGLRGADSWATDAHKWLNVAYDCGIAFVRRGEDLRRTFAVHAGYLPIDGGYDAMHHTPQSSQRARQIEVWAALRSLGRSGVADLVSRLSAHASTVAENLSAAGLEVVNDVVLNQVLVRAGDDATTEAWIDAIQSDGTCWCGPTDWQGRLAMRVSVSSWATTDKDIQLSVDAMIRCARSAGALPS